jgi:O-antigen/teichoic acid export membrane protein
MNQLLIQRLNSDITQPGFTLMSSFACRKADFLRSGGFDERFFFGSEDREFISRVRAAGEVVVFDPSIVVEHRHEFRVGTFLRYYFKLGKSSHLFYNVAHRERPHLISKPSYQDVLRLVAQTAKGHGFIDGILALTAQFFVWLGYIGSRLEGATDLRSENPQTGRSMFAGRHGTFLGLMSFFGGNMFSSAFSLLSFLIIGNALPIPAFGVFMVAFSLESILSTIGNAGLPLSVTRYASEFSKQGNEENAGSILKTGFALQILIALSLVVLGLFLLEPTVGTALTVDFPPGLYTAVLVGSVGTILYNYTASVFSTYLRFLNLALLRSVVSAVRFAIILSLTVASLATPVNLYWAFILPHWLGFAVAYAVLRKQVRGKGSIQMSYARAILTYGGWNTVSNVSRLMTTHLGSLILAASTTEREVGIFGLGQTLSFVYGVISTTASQYFMPIGARVTSNEDVMPFVRRAMRLVLPLFVLSLISLVFAEPIVRLIYGESRLVAVPTFILLSLPIIVGMAMVSVNVLFHYFFKPYLVSLENVLRMGLFLAGAFWLAPSTGATGVAAVLCVSGMLVHLISFLLLAREFKKRGLSLQPRVWRSFGFSAKS